MTNHQTLPSQQAPTNTSPAGNPVSPQTTAATIQYPVCFGVLGQDCPNIATVCCLSGPCQPMCERCAILNHSIEVFQRHSLRQGPGKTCMFSPISNCGKIAECICTGCSELQACQDCMQKQHRKMSDHQNLVHSIENPLYPHEFHSLGCNPPTNEMTPETRQREEINAHHPYVGEIQRDRSFNATIYDANLDPPYRHRLAEQFEQTQYPVIDPRSNIGSIHLSSKRDGESGEKVVLRAAVNSGSYTESWANDYLSSTPNSSPRFGQSTSNTNLVPSPQKPKDPPAQGSTLKDLSGMFVTSGTLSTPDARAIARRKEKELSEKRAREASEKNPPSAPSNKKLNTQRQ